MKSYEIEIENKIASFFEGVSVITELPVETMLSKVLTKYVETITKKIVDPLNDYDDDGVVTCNE